MRPKRTPLVGPGPADVAQVAISLAIVAGISLAVAWAVPGAFWLIVGVVAVVVIAARG